MILVSGINSDGKSILFGWGFFKDPNIDSYSWFLNKFIQFMAEGEIPEHMASLVEDPEM